MTDPTGANMPDTERTEVMPSVPESESALDRARRARAESEAGESDESESAAAGESESPSLPGTPAVESENNAENWQDTFATELDEIADAQDAATAEREEIIEVTDADDAVAGADEAGLGHTRAVELSALAGLPTSDGALERLGEETDTLCVRSVNYIAVRTDVDSPWAVLPLHELDAASDRERESPTACARRLYPIPVNLAWAAWAGWVAAFVLLMVQLLTGRSDELLLMVFALSLLAMAVSGYFGVSAASRALDPLRNLTKVGRAAAVDRAKRDDTALSTVEALAIVVLDRTGRTGAAGRLVSAWEASAPDMPEATAFARASTTDAWRQIAAADAEDENATAAAKAIAAEAARTTWRTLARP